MHVDDGLTLGIEGCRADVRPISGFAGLTCRAALSGLLVQGVAGCQDVLILSGVALRRADVADAAVAMRDMPSPSSMIAQAVTCA